MKTTTKAKRIGRCNIFSGIWSAIYGCEGRGEFFRWGVGNFGRNIREYACATCRAAEIETNREPALRQEKLRIAREKAGVIEYRNARYEMRDGRPVITYPGHLAGWPRG